MSTGPCYLGHVVCDFFPFLGSYVSAALGGSHNKSILGRFTYLFIVVQEHCVIESKPDHFLDDLRLHNPWTELKQYECIHTFNLHITVCNSFVIIHKLTVIVDTYVSQICKIN